MQLLLARYDDLKIGAGLGEIVECDAGDGAGSGGEADVDARFLKDGMGEKVRTRAGVTTVGKEQGPAAEAKGQVGACISFWSLQVGPAGP